MAVTLARSRPRRSPRPRARLGSRRPTPARRSLSLRRARRLGPGIRASRSPLARPARRIRRPRRVRRVLPRIRRRWPRPIRPTYRPPRRPWLRWRPDWRWRLPYPRISVYLPGRRNGEPGLVPGLERITSEARRTLSQRGLLNGVWLDRLARASRLLIRFVNRFHRTAGFDHVVRDYFAGRHQRAASALAMRFAHRLADRYPNFGRHLSFERTLSIAPGGHPVRAVHLSRAGVRYEFKPWSRLHPLAVQGQFLRDMVLVGHPSRVRWVFDGRRLGMPKRQAVRAVRRILTASPAPPFNHSEARRWLNTLDRLILVI